MHRPASDSGMSLAEQAKSGVAALGPHGRPARCTARPRNVYPVVALRARRVGGSDRDVGAGRIDWTALARLAARRLGAIDGRVPSPAITWPAGWARRRPMVSRREFFDHLQEILKGESATTDHDETGRVRVVSAENARNLSAPYRVCRGSFGKGLSAAASRGLHPQRGRDRALGSPPACRWCRTPIGAVTRCCCSMRS